MPITNPHKDTSIFPVTAKTGLLSPILVHLSSAHESIARVIFWDVRRLCHFSAPKLKVFHVIGRPIQWKSSRLIKSIRKHAQVQVFCKMLVIRYMQVHVPILIRQSCLDKSCTPHRVFFLDTKTYETFHYYLSTFMYHWSVISLVSVDSSSFISLDYTSVSSGLGVLPHKVTTIFPRVQFLL